MRSSTAVLIHAHRPAMSQIEYPVQLYDVLEVASALKVIFERTILSIVRVILVNDRFFFSNKDFSAVLQEG